jgi:asparagine synthetase B (glutamine-hydrolysing)
VMSIHGKECRHPFLDEGLIELIGGMPLSVVVADRADEGWLNKWLLRHLAKCMGLRACVDMKKRAIQFGSRSAKLSNRKYFESNKKAEGTVTYVPRAR